MCLLCYLIKCVHIWNICKSVSHGLAKYLCKLQNRYEYNRVPKFYWYGLRFHTEVNILKTICGVLVKCQEGYWHFYKKYIKILSTFQRYIWVKLLFSTYTSRKTVYHNRLNAKAYMRLQLCSIKPDIKMTCKMFNIASLLMSNFCFENIFYKCTIFLLTWNGNKL